MTATTIEGWQQSAGDILLALATRFPEEARRARAALLPLLAEADAADGVGWSRLAPGGSPVEFVWRPGEAGAFWTCEVAGPGTAERDRLDAGLRLLDRHGWKAPDPAAMEFWRTLQRGAALDWGCWLGGRHRQSGDSGKLYVEVPAERGGEAASMPAAAKAFWPEGGRLRLVGLAADSTEFYWRLAALAPEVLHRTASAVGAVAALPALADAFGRMRGRDAATALDGAKLGLSLTVDETGAARAMALFIGGGRAGDGAIAERLADVAAKDDPLFGLWRAGRLRAGVAACGLSAAGISFQIGLAPVRAAS